jgi:hypothetical protein
MPKLLKGEIKMNKIAFTPELKRLINTARYNKLKDAIPTESQEFSKKGELYCKELIDVFNRYCVPFDIAVRIINEWSELNMRYFSDSPPNSTPPHSND